MDGSSSPITAHQNNTDFSDKKNRARILGGVIGGTFGISIVVLLIYLVAVKLIQRKERQKARNCQENVIKNIDDHRYNNITNEQNVSNVINRGKSRTHSILDIIRTARPFPSSPREPPALPPKRPYATKNLHHETPHIHEYGAGGGTDHTNPFI